MSTVTLVSSNAQSRYRRGAVIGGCASQSRIHMASFLGIDLSKETFYVTLLSDRGDAKRAFPNTSKGFAQLTAWLKNRHAADVRICMEATGAYWEALAAYLHELKHQVSVINPARIKAFAQSELLRTKTDAIDAALIARFCRSQVPEAWIPPAAEIHILQALMRHYEHLKTIDMDSRSWARCSRRRPCSASLRNLSGRERYRWSTAAAT